MPWNVGIDETVGFCTRRVRSAYFSRNISVTVRSGHERVRVGTMRFAFVVVLVENVRGVRVVVFAVVDFNTAPNDRAGSFDPLGGVVDFSDGAIEKTVGSAQANEHEDGTECPHETSSGFVAIA